MSIRDIGGLLLLSSIWGAAFMFNDVVVRDVSPMTIVAGRLLIAAVVLIPIAWATSAVLPPRAAWPPILFLAAFNNVVPFALITWAQDSITSSLAATLVATMPLFTLLFVYSLHTERPDVERVFGLLIGFVGTAILIGPDLGDFTSSGTLGEIGVIVAAAFYAISTVVAREKAAGEPLSLASGQMIFGAAMAVPLALAIDGLPRFDIPADAAASWVALGVLPSGLAYVLFFTLVQRITATQLSLVSYLIPIVATLLGWLVLDETIGVNLLAGLGLIIVGVAAVNGVGRQQVAHLLSRDERERVGASRR